ncbi:MAG: metal ABC transporter ATP-binding protein [Spirulinaceae cyanobacterium]
MLEVLNLVVNYRDTLAVEGISFCLKQGQVTGLLGPNGAGKSTIVKAILGLIPITRGQVRFCSRPLKQQLRRVAYVPQRNQIDWDYPIKVENVAMMGRIRAAGWLRSPNYESREIVKDALKRVGMWQYHQHQIRELSGGQQQRVFLARAIAQQADLLFFDEPFAGIDKKTEEVIFAVFAELKAQNKTLLVINHDLGNSLDHYDNLILLNKHLIATGSKTEVIAPENLRKAYGKTLLLANS